MKTVFELNSLAFPIKLHQMGKDRFAVTYGKQFNTSLTYAEACKELGASILHALACDGKIDNA